MIFAHLIAAGASGHRTSTGIVPSLRNNLPSRRNGHHRKGGFPSEPHRHPTPDGQAFPEDVRAECLPLRYFSACVQSFDSGAPAALASEGVLLW